VDYFSIKGVIMKKMTRGILLTIFLVVSACSPNNIHEDITIPNTDIVYQAINNQLGNDAPSNDLLGFVNSDGSGNVLVKLYYRPYTPIVSKDWGGIVFRVNMRNPITLDESGGALYFLQSDGKYKICDQHYYESFFFPLPGKKSVLVSSAYSIDLLNIETCKTQTLVKIPQEVPWKRFLVSATPSDSGKKAVFYEIFSTPIQHDVIFILDIDSGKINAILEGGYNPSLSPDEKKIAYLGNEGIYVAQIDGTIKKLLVPISFNPHNGLDPHPFWSPDGNMLIYHKCSNTVCKDVSDFSIFKVNVYTGVENKIIDGGLYPTWIK
jgi:hypothetical protein